MYGNGLRNYRYQDRSYLGPCDLVSQILGSATQQGVMIRFRNREINNERATKYHACKEVARCTWNHTNWVAISGAEWRDIGPTDNGYTSNGMTRDNYIWQYLRY